jgi:hypothetical protein
MPQTLSFFIYDAHPRIFQLYRQLPEAIYVLQKRTATQHDSNNSALRFPEREEYEGKGDERRRKYRPAIPHLGTEGAQTFHREWMLEKNEMYQRRRVLQALRQSGQLQRALPGLPFCPGVYYELEGAFRPLQETRDCPEGAVWLHSAEGPCGPAIRLLCNKRYFSGELGEHTFQEFFCVAEPLPLRGVAVCLQRGELFFGLPLFLVLCN